jgi:hypothetical protein
MNFLKKTLLLGTIALASMASQAELMETDWKNIGDGNATLDTETGLEWLDLTETTPMYYDLVVEQLDTTFSGWRLPTETEIKELYAHAFSNYDPQSSATSIAATTTDKENWDSLFSDDIVKGMAIYLSDNGTLRQTGMWSGTLYTTLYGSTVSGGYGHSQYGTFLVSDGGTTLSSLANPSLNANNPNAPTGGTSVPLPATGLLLGLALTGFGVSRKKRK